MKEIIILSKFMESVMCERYDDFLKNDVRNTKFDIKKYINNDINDEIL